MSEKYTICYKSRVGVERNVINCFFLSESSQVKMKTGEIESVSGILLLPFLSWVVCTRSFHLNWNSKMALIMILCRFCCCCVVPCQIIAMILAVLLSPHSAEIVEDDFLLFFWKLLQHQKRKPEQQQRTFYTSKLHRRCAWRSKRGGISSFFKR